MHGNPSLIGLAVTAYLIGLPQAGEPTPPDVQARVDGVVEQLREAMGRRDVEAVRRETDRLRAALGEWAGVPETQPQFRPPPDATPPLSPPRHDELWARAWRRAEADYAGDGRWGLPKTDHPEVRRGLLRHTAYSVMGGLAAMEHGVGDRGVIAQHVRAGLAYLRSVQQPDGLFPFPDARTWSNHFRPPLQALYELHPDAFYDGWVIEDHSDGGLQFDNGVCAVAMLRAFEQLRDDEIMASARRACEWAAGRPIVVNWNYNAFSVWALAEYTRVTGDPRFIAPAVGRLRIGILPGQLPAGRWVDRHNARTVYHAIILRAMATLQRVLPEEHPLRTDLRSAIQLAERVLVDEILSKGPSDADHSLSALCAVAQVLPPDPRRSEAIRVLAHAMDAGLVGREDQRLDDLTLFAVGELLRYRGRMASSQPGSSRPHATPEVP